jgi:DNA mismatch repair protein MutL
VTGRPVRRLADALINKIAAGEVVERPASVVKELVENSLDAGARQVDVAIRGAGRHLVTVSDDGHGMTPEDCALAVERHATSKVATEADLETVSTLGFRGEALAAIFAVSRVSLFSRPAAAPRGHLLVGEGGVVLEAGPADGPPGTTVEVRDLLFNTPARAKFLKSPATEQGAVLRVVTQLALAHPHVHVRLTANGRVLLNAPAATDLRERVGALYGHGLAGDLLVVAGQAGTARLTGLVAPPARARTHREDIHLLVNGRAVRDTLLTQALLEAYRPLLPRDRFPLAVLALAIEPHEVDVNVHPTKAWVRVRHPRALHELVHAAVSRAVRQAGGAPAGWAARALSAESPTLVLDGPPAPAEAQVPLFREEGAPYRDATLFGRVVGQIEETFVVAHTADEVFFVDQHVAHERVLFERLQRDLAAGTLASQALLFPQALELAPARLRALAALLPELGRLGFELETFGEGAVLLRGVPSVLRADEPQRLCDDLARAVEEEGARAGSPVIDRLLAVVACRGAIKAHQALGHDEMAALLRDLAETATPYYCPHGRPIVSRVPLSEIRRDLQRTWS